MKTLFFSLIAALLVAPVRQAKADTLRVASTVDAVTVFFSGAMVDRQASIAFKKGKQTLCFTQLPRSLKPETVQLAGLKFATILVVKHAIETPTQQDDPVKRRQLEVEEKRLIRENEQIKAEIAVLQQEEQILLKNAHVAGENGVKVAALRETADFYRQRLGEIRKIIFEHSYAIERNQDRLKAVYQQINGLRGPIPTAQTVVYVTLEAKRAYTDTLHLKYYDEAAGWLPAYDFRVEDLRQPLQINYLADVFQFSGEDWKNVKLTLSTANPALSGDKPLLKPWYFGRHEQRPEPPSQKNSENGGYLRGRVLDGSKNEGVPFANVVLYREGLQVAGTTSDIDGKYEFKRLAGGTYAVRCSYVGYNPYEISAIRVAETQSVLLDITLNSTIALKEVIISDYEVPLISRDDLSTGGTYTREDIQRSNASSSGGRRIPQSAVESTSLNIRSSRSQSNEYYIDGIRVRGGTSGYGMEAFLPRSPELLQYNIENRQSIPSDGENQRVPIKDEKVKARFVHHAVPKLSNDVFLVAEIAPWGYLNLLDGSANLYYQGTFVGATEVRTKTTGDTLRLALGRDRSVVIERKLALDQESRKTIGNTVRQQMKWDILVRNQKDYPIELQVDDQLPISQHKSVEITHETAPKAIVEEHNGLVRWQLTVPGGEKVSLQLNYQVKYPAGFGGRY